MQRPALFIIWLAALLLFNTPVNAESIEGKVVTSKGDSGRCEFHEYYIMSDNRGGSMGYNFNNLKLRYMNLFSLRKVTHLGLVDLPCKKMKVGLRTKDIIGHKNCFSISFENQGTHILCPSQRNYSKFYFNLLNALKRVRKVTNAEYKQHRQLMVFMQNYRKFYTAPFRTREEH